MSFGARPWLWDMAVSTVEIGGIELCFLRKIFSGQVGVFY